MGVTLKFQSSGMVPGDARPVPMRGGSLTVGRGDTNDLVLPDPDKVLSKNHCVIEDHNGNVVIVDLSTNGTFLNYSKIALGRTPTPLNDGDVLSLGGYELVVEIGSGASADDLLPGPMDEGAIGGGRAEDAPDGYALLDAAGPEGDFLDDLLGGQAQGPSGMSIPDPIEELLPSGGDSEAWPGSEGPDTGPHGDSGLLHGASISESLGPDRSAPAGGGIIPDDWDADPFEDEGEPTVPPARPVPPPPDAAAAAPVPAPKEPPAAIPDPAPNDPPVAPAGPEDQAATRTEDSAARAFLAALDPELEVPDADLRDTLARLGRVTREMIAGLREILMTRTSIKGEFRIDQTHIAAGDNNPLKFSVTPEQAIEAMARPRTRGYLDAETATREALEDIKAHEVAMVTGMEAALRGVLKKLDPAALSAQIETRGNLGGLFQGKKARYWDVYEKMYAEISDQAENDFHELFSREFARAYKEQLARLKNR